LIKEAFMVDIAILDSIVLPLADNYEAGNRHFVSITPSSFEEYEPLRVSLAELIAEESLENFEKTHVYRFTNKGYLKYKPRIGALRSMGQPG
jgi:hypothetical protein